jgi:CoA-transferase family III
VVRHGRAQRLTSRSSGQAILACLQSLVKEEWFRACAVKEAVDTFSNLGIPINAVNGIPAAPEPHLHERELLVEVPDPVAGRIHVSGTFTKLSRSELAVGSAPTPGQVVHARHRALPRPGDDLLACLRPRLFCHRQGVARGLPQRHRLGALHEGRAQLLCGRHPVR